jgi:hypothetical protein
MKQTAAEWLFEKLWNTDKDKFTWHAILKQAKEMEKEYIKKGWLQDRDITFGDWQQEFEQWYSQEFKQQEQ